MDLSHSPGKCQEDKEQWGLLEKSFSANAGQKGTDHHLEAGVLHMRFKPLACTPDMFFGEYERDLHLNVSLFKSESEQQESLCPKVHVSFDAALPFVCVEAYLNERLFNRNKQELIDRWVAQLLCISDMLQAELPLVQFGTKFHASALLLACKRHTREEEAIHKSQDEEEAKEKTREEQLYEVPSNLQVPNFFSVQKF